MSQLAPTIPITYLGEARTLKFGLLAYHKMGLNPFEPASVEEWKSKTMDLDVAARLISAGLLHEYYGKHATRKGQTPPTPEDVLTDMDNLDEFVGAFKSVMEVLGERAESAETEEPTPNPQAA